MRLFQLYSLWLIIWTLLFQLVINAINSYQSSEVLDVISPQRKDFQILQAADPRDLLNHVRAETQLPTICQNGQGIVHFLDGRQLELESDFHGIGDVLARIFLFPFLYGIFYWSWHLGPFGDWSGGYTFLVYDQKHRSEGEVSLVKFHFMDLKSPWFRLPLAQAQFQAKINSSRHDEHLEVRNFSPLWTLLLGQFLGIWVWMSRFEHFSSS